MICEYLLTNGRVLEFNLEAACKAKEIDAVEKDKRDMLVYCQYKTGRF